MFPKSPQHRSEAWRQVPGFPEYEVSDCGNVRRASGGQGAVAGRLLTWGRHTSNGYPDVRLTVNNRPRRFNVHTLVASAFLGPRPDGMVTRHLDGDKWNPHVSNLAYGTPKENSLDDVAHGKTHKGERNGNSKLETQDVNLIMHLKSVGVSATSLAKKVGVHESTIHRIVRGETWAHVRS